MKISAQEALHIIVSVLTISLAFSFVQQGISLGGHVPVFDFSNFFAVLVTVGLGFILHELAHKYVAISNGTHAEYHAWTLGLLAAIVMAVSVGFVFAAPGAVYIYGNVSREKNGWISLAGPLTNLALAIVFLLVYFLVPGLHDIGIMGAYVNTFLGLFNMLPFGPLDGKKVADWSPKVWLATFASLALIFLGLIAV